MKYSLTEFCNNYAKLTNTDKKKKKGIFEKVTVIRIEDEKGEILVDNKEKGGSRRAVTCFYPNFLLYLSETYTGNSEMLKILDGITIFKKTKEEAESKPKDPEKESSKTVYEIELGEEKRFWGGISSNQGMNVMGRILNEIRAKNIPQFNEDLDKLFLYFEKKDSNNQEYQEPETENEESEENVETISVESYNVKEIIEDTINRNKQVIFTGAPGTGKTYSVRNIINEKVNGDKSRFKFVQFHPSYDYSDFVEGLRPVVLLGQTEPTFVRMDGTFKAFCRHVVEENKENGNEEKEYYFVVDEINRGDLSKVFGELMFGLEEAYRGEENAFDTQYKNLKTYRVLDTEDKGRVIAGKEITEADFGHAVPVEKDVFEKGFYIPKNLYFIGTMNDIDRSVDSMDFALRRRFMWADIKANEIMESSMEDMYSDQDDDIKAEAVKLSKKIIKMNEVMTSEKFRKLGLTEAYHIGPAYFKNLNTESVEDMKDSLKEIFEHNVVSILREYLRGRRENEVKDLIKGCREALLQGEN